MARLIKPDAHFLSVSLPAFWNRLMCGCSGYQDLHRRL